MKIAPVAEVKAQFSAYLKAAEEGPVVVTRHGKAVAVLLSAEDDDELERLILGYTPKFQGILEAARKQIQETGGVPHDELWQDVETEEQKD
jgi:prevent-host-death family protein